VKVLVY